ncbi:MAG: hypothetical protein BXU00_01790 [Candidatus Nanoclepta minutus]|uniref:Uncharacterized protein n=1 Tax=Candidatus Nanoclepta minutus TaxID=1940235 RepID=A0A397WPI3_9ARCH|nr:MAG: hypothetical protein BXU00_01790 [Candidatus Nanoclepta minutus]
MFIYDLISKKDYILMASNYRIGYYYERKVKNILEKEDWDVWRSPASHSPIDIIAIKPQKGYVKIKLIQVKRTSREDIKAEYFKYDIDNLKEFAKKYKDCENIEIELWIFKKQDRNPYIMKISS